MGNVVVARPGGDLSGLSRSVDLSRRSEPERNHHCAATSGQGRGNAGSDWCGVGVRFRNASYAYAAGTVKYLQNLPTLRIGHAVSGGKIIDHFRLGTIQHTLRHAINQGGVCCFDCVRPFIRVLGVLAQKVEGQVVGK